MKNNKSKFIKQILFVIFCIITFSNSTTVHAAENFDGLYFDSTSVER